jgi:hypothetical protein
MGDVAWEMTHSVETDARADFAWKYWTDITNWDDPPAEFELAGPFVAGSRGLTRIPGQEPVHWLIRDVTPDEAASIEIPVDGAALAFEWRFAALADGRTRLTQRVMLRGEKADAYLEYAKIYAANLPAGMKRMAALIAEAAAKHKTATP